VRVGKQLRCGERARAVEEKPLVGVPAEVPVAEAHEVVPQRGPLHPEKPHEFRCWARRL